MSLVPFALRVCATRALQAALPANVMVIDSPQEPIDLLDKASPRPIVAVYTGSAMTKLEGRNLLGGAPVVLLTVQMFLPETFAFEASPDRVVTVDTRRQGAETALDILWRSVLLALNGSPEPWAALWRGDYARRREHRKPALPPRTERREGDGARGDAGMRADPRACARGSAFRCVGRIDFSDARGRAGRRSFGAGGLGRGVDPQRDAIARGSRRHLSWPLILCRAVTPH